MNRISLTVATVIVAAHLGTPSRAPAQEYPDMVGEWTGTVEGIVLGEPRHFNKPGAGDPAPRIATFELTISITHQEGRFIWGTHTGGADVEPWLGTISSDGTSLRAVDSDGYIIGTILSENEFENCYLHTGDTMVASCAIMTRQ